MDFHNYDYLNLKNHCNELRDTVFYGLDIPCSIGLAPTKTLAKVAYCTTIFLVSGI
ncbi:hypothetical protein [Chryseobacterium sp. 5_R23647]|uniref:Y-family DNA polymerase n=1 Tax=Chryseobacterium sp. 5_R23647 TaxID=2258964 RepID=UPI000E286AFE|nr:hypothetical protein DRF69_19675 [Chryseobacterium sp. 5_R23647]